MLRIVRNINTLFGQDFNIKSPNTLVLLGDVDNCKVYAAFVMDE